MQKEFLKSTEGFLRAALTVQGHPGPVWKIAKLALFDPCMEFENFLGQMTLFEVLLMCHSLTLSKKCLRLRPALSKCLSERINWIISTIPHRISKILFVYCSYELLAMLEGKIREAPFFKVQSCKITVCLRSISNINFQSWAFWGSSKYIRPLNKTGALLAAFC